MRFESIAVLDLETTSLMNAKITEICIVACDRGSIERSLGELPRVLHKFTVCVNPGVKIHPFSSEISGLDNERLSNSQVFDQNLVESLRLFLERLPKPTVLLAHNGFKFDFIHLRNEIRNILSPMLNFHCADTLIGFRTILNRPMNEKIKFLPELDDPEGDEICSLAMDVICEESFLKNPSQEENENTPDRRQKILLMAPKKEMLPFSSPGNNTARRTLFPINDRDEFESTIATFENEHDQRNHYDFRGKPRKFGLADLFEYFHGYRPHTSHTAESDVISLLQCILKLPDSFLNFIDQNAILLEKL